MEEQKNITQNDQDMIVTVIEAGITILGGIAAIIASGIFTDKE